MSVQYSPTKINTFNGCKLRYRYQYIDRIPSDLTTIEQFRGSRVHEVLEEFYKLVKQGSIKPLDWVLKKYKELWDKNYTDSIKVVKDKLLIEDYFNKGEESLKDYYDKYKPFNQAKIVATENLINFDIKSGEEEYAFCGIMDRLDYNDKENIFEIHDYKVSSSLMTQEVADNDWQLGIYQIALEKKWPDVEKVKLVWHSLLFNKEIVSFRAKDQIDELKKNVVRKIKEIESCKDFIPQKSALCDWCDYQNICPLWRHPKKVENLDINEYKNEPGVKLVAEYKKLEEEKNEHKEEILRIEEDQDKIKGAAIDLAEKQNISILDGPEAQLKIDIKEEMRAPTRSENQSAWEELRDLLIKEGKYEDVSTVNANMLNFRIRSGSWSSDFVQKISGFLIKKRTEAVRLIKKIK